MLKLLGHNSGRTCPCTISKIWLDIVIGIDVSTGVNGQINGIKTMLAQIIGALTVAQSGTQVSRVALYTFAGNDGNPSVNVIAYLGTFNSTDDAVNALFNIQSTSIVDVPLLKALTTAAGIFKRSDNRPNARDVLILLSSKGADCTASGSAPADLCRTASDMNENGVEIISVQLDLGAGQYFDGLGNPCYRLQNDGHQAHNIINAFCQINCFCTKGYEQYIPYDNTCQKMGECVQGVEDGAAWNFAKIGCQRQNAFLADELSTQKHAFLQVLAIKISGGGAKMIPYWIGLNDKSPSGVYSWDRGTDPSMPLLSGDYTIWPSSAPNDQNGQKQCIAVDQYNHGFNLAWINQPCNSFDFTPAYFCQKNTCDTDNYCATP
uniref:Uncharacterized protein n=1 Tax=Plectus sambesii TaxID=2011161 RepID=A0A914WH80_9BILA